MTPIQSAPQVEPPSDTVPEAMGTAHAVARMAGDVTRAAKALGLARGGHRPRGAHGHRSGSHRGATRKRSGLSPRSRRRSIVYDATLTMTATAFAFVMPFVIVPLQAAADPAYLPPTGSRLRLLLSVSVAASLAMVVRRRWPLVPAALATVDLWLQGLRLLYPIGLYTLVVRGRWREAACVAVAGGLAPLGPLATVNGPPAPPLVLAINIFLYHFLPYVLVPGLVGVSVRAHRLRIEVMRDHAQRLVREEELATRNARLEERARIARDLHDVVAHYVGLIVIQAGALELRSAQLAPETAQVASLIGGLGRSSMGELRDLLDVLRSDTDEQPPPSDEPATAAWRQEVEDLVTRTRQTGIEVTWELRGELAQAHAPANDIAFRVVQEGLSNALRHAPGAPAEVLVEALADELRVRVHNGPASKAHPDGPPPSGHYGLKGMRERITSMGGTLLAEPAPDGGFQLSATIPTIGPLDDPRSARRRRSPGAPGDQADTRNR